MLLAHARTLCEARSALAMLSDRARCLESSSAYERVLITLDTIYGDDCPAIDTHGIPTQVDDLLAFAVHALKQLKSHGVDELHIELLLSLLYDAADWDVI